jgi:hypothetical protein
VTDYEFYEEDGSSFLLEDTGGSFLLEGPPFETPVAVPVPTTEELFDGTFRVVAGTVYWQILDKDNSPLGQLVIDRSRPLQMTNDTTRTIRRTVDELKIPPRPLFDTDVNHFYAEDIVPALRVRPWWLLPNGAQFSMGVFVFSDDSRVLWSYGLPRSVTLTDLTADLDQPLVRSTGYGIGTPVYDAMIREAEQEGFGINERIIEANTDAQIGQPIGWAAGRDTRLTVLESLCQIAGFLPPYVDNNGKLVCRSVPDLTTATPAFSYGADTVVLPGSAVLSDDWMTAPNRYAVIGGAFPSGTEVVNPPEIVGVYDIPDAAPNSYKNIGRRRRKTVDIQGIKVQWLADLAAKAEYTKDSSSHTWLGFNTPPDPRHDTFDVVSFAGQNYRQIGWTMELVAGGTMHHDCRATFQ